MKLSGIYIGFAVGFFLYFSSTIMAFGQVNIQVDISKEGYEYSPYIFGKNNTLSGQPDKPLSETEWRRIKDSGLTILRENGGNNSTKYNWRRKISSHPDWYNNVYAHDWDFEAQSLSNNLPDVSGIFGFQVLGVAAKTNEHNFNEWEFNRAQYWDGVHQNLAGGGIVNESGGSEALEDGDPDLYLMEWPADSTTDILEHWFSAEGLSLSKDQFQYWCMDNEPGIWFSTHDDIADANETAEEYIQKYFKVAKAARERFPEIKLVGPIAANEWQWYTWHNNQIDYNGSSYSFLEYFILRIAEEQKATGIRLLDVFSIHFYPNNTNVEEVVQFHRVFFDEHYDYPDANGVKTINGGWDDTITKEYVFKRVNDWLEEHIGVDHGVGLGVTETGVNIDDQNGVAVWYASTLGEFMKNRVEVFTPWSWQPAMWEVVNLFTEFSQDKYFDATSSDAEYISAYCTASDQKDKITTILVNRSVDESKNVRVDLTGVFIDKSSLRAFQLSDLSNSESFFSNDNNALIEIDINSGYKSFDLVMPPLSVVAVTFDKAEGIVTDIIDKTERGDFRIYPNPYKTGVISLKSSSVIEKLEIISMEGKIVMEIHNPGETVDVSDLPDRKSVV